MSLIYWRSSTGSTDLPIADGSHEIKVPIRDIRHQVFVAFVNSSGALVAPTSGKAKVHASMIEGQWHEASSTSEINASEAGPDALYIVPEFLGGANKVRLTLEGISGSGVAHARAIYWGAD